MLKGEDQAWVNALAEANGLTSEQTLEHLLEPDVGGGSGWQATVRIHDGRFSSIDIGTQVMHFAATKRRKAHSKLRGTTKIARVVVPELPGLHHLQITSGNVLPAMVDLRHSPIVVLILGGQPEMEVLRTGPELDHLGLSRDKALKEVDLTESTAASQIDLFETSGTRFTCWDIQLATIANLSRLKRRCDLQTSTSEILRAAARNPLHQRNGKVLGAFVAHPACPGDLALQIYWALAPEVYQRYASVGACPIPELKAGFKVLTAIEKRSEWATPLGAELKVRFDLKDWSRAPKPDLAIAAGVVLKGTASPAPPPPKARRSKAAKPSVAAEEDAILDRFKAWLEHPLELGSPPDSVEIIWRKVLPIGEQKVRTCLVNWTQGDHGFVGIAGPFEWSFMGLSVDRLEPIRKSARHRRLVNLYWGWWMCFNAAQKPGYGDLPRLDARGLEAAFAEETTSVRLDGFCITVGREFDPHVGTRQIARERCTLRCHEEPQVYIDPKKVRHYAVKAAIDYAYPGGTLTAEYQLFFRTGADGRIKRASMRHTEPGKGGVIDDLPLFHWVGSNFGPFFFGTKGWPTLYVR